MGCRIAKDGNSQTGRGYRRNDGAQQVQFSDFEKRIDPVSIELFKLLRLTSGFRIARI
jgi:hypothetical protein